MIFKNKAVRILLLMTVSQSVFAKKWAFKINPIYSLIGVQDFGFDFEGIDLNQKLSVFGLYSNLDAVDIDIRGYGFGVLYSFHTAGIFQDGWFGGPSIGYGSLEFQDDRKNETGEVKVLTYGLFGGYQIVWDDFFIEFVGKYGRKLDAELKVKNESTGEDVDEELPESAILIDFKIGFIF